MRVQGLELLLKMSGKQTPQSLQCDPLRIADGGRVSQHADAVAVDAVGVVHGLEREQVAEGRAVGGVVGQLDLRRRARAQPVDDRLHRLLFGRRALGRDTPAGGLGGLTLTPRVARL